ncbi:LptF/LptG family permease [Hymenobacter negativus]|uniref:LptF/LptG family permease n=1 Tax=Hymenobacter negativus TaxID=2795026 RepID=A0ABS0Q4Q5_9BACT|nr:MULTISPECIES: LptF/LptG family permease [Bacteria]MBH8557552.1 LptF/LptG family permease [Hymenobacter negativus]MBH8567916.1 LptF/LptG family permease [Hymenobacter negativus]MBR7207652.1 LptF/LptG family permease [Microvirga sp. STS02]
MNILDKYIIKKFLAAFFFSVVILVTVICVIDFTEKNDDFIQHNLSMSKIIFGYYIYLFPYFANLLSPITIFIAVVFVTAQLAARTEIVAILASGVSFRRLMLPYAMGGAVVGLMIFGLIGWVLPIGNKSRVAFERAYIKLPYRFQGRNVHMKIGPRSYVYMESYDNLSNIGFHFALETVDSTVLRRRLTADAINWDSTRHVWHLSPQLVRTFKGSQDETLQTLPARDTTMNLRIEDFASTYKLAETMTLPQLNAYIKDKIERGADDTQLYLSEKYERYAYPFSIVILTLIGVILSARKSRAGVGGQIALGFVLAFVFIIFVMLSRNLAQVGSLSPMLAAWIPSTIFSVIGLALYRFVPK